MSILLAVACAVSLNGMHLHDDPQRSQTYKPSSMGEAIADTPVVDGAVYTVDSAGRRYAVDLQYTGKRRIRTESRSELLMRWAQTLELTAKDIDRFAEEIEVSDGAETYWLLVSPSLAEKMTQQLSSGAHVKVLMVYIGAVGSERVFGLEDFGNGQSAQQR